MLLAKGHRPPRPDLSLEAHSQDTEKASIQLFGNGSRWGETWARFFRLPDREAFLINLRVAALLHDIGKANEDFQRAVRGELAGPQSVRHEHFSALLLHLPAVREWLARSVRLDLAIVTAAVLSHHLKADDGGEWAWCQARGSRDIGLLLQDPQIAAILRRVADVAALPDPPTLRDMRWQIAPPWTEAWAAGVDAGKRLRREIRKDPARQRLLAAIKAAVIVSDAASSGLVREGHPLPEWIDERANAAPLTSADIREGVLAGRILELEQRRRQPFEFHRFQTEVAGRGDRVLLLAACGTGKTLAAWNWAAAVASRRAVGRVIFLYPTRGTATEGFRDYVAWAPELEAALVTGTAQYELEAMRENPSEATRGHDFSRTEAEERLFSLGLWSKRYFSATVDQFLGYLENYYGALCLLPMLADAAVVIDEVHSFDRRMFDDLVAFLVTFDVPVLCMTATLPASRRAELDGLGLVTYPASTDRAELADLEAQETHSRYSIRRCDRDAARMTACAAFRDGLRVLWVVNTVGRCQALADELEMTLGVPVTSYHSRFRLIDRQRRHRETVDAFQQRDRAAIAVTTQVCEMSLDLDADVLVTERAPVASLVQRFGRANRHRARGDAFCASILVYEPESIVPYASDEMKASARFLGEVVGEQVSQRALADALVRHAPGEPAADGSARFLDGGYYAVAGSFREEEDRSRPCVLETDLSAVLESITRRRPIDAYLVSVPRRSALSEVERPSRLPTYVGIASADNYSERRGFRAEGSRP